MNNYLSKSDKSFVMYIVYNIIKIAPKKPNRVKEEKIIAKTEITQYEELDATYIILIGKINAQNKYHRILIAFRSVIFLLNLFKIVIPLIINEISVINERKRLIIATVLFINIQSIIPFIVIFSKSIDYKIFNK